jgi:hypothetical protein
MAIGKPDLSEETTTVRVVFNQKPKNASIRISGAMADLEGAVETEDATNAALEILQGLLESLQEQHAERV